MPQLRTDANIPGTEKIVVADVRPELVDRSLPELKVSDVTSPPDMMSPMGAFLVKGWSRSVCAVACLRHAFEELEAGSPVAFVLGPHAVAGVVD